MAQSIAKVEVSEQQRQELLRIVRASGSSQRDVRRARIVLLRADGKSQAETAHEVGVNRPVVALWEQRFRSKGLAGLKDAKGRGRKTSIAPQTVQRVVTEAVQPPAGRTRWSVRTMAEHARISPAQVQRIWSVNDIKPHVLRTFKLSKDKDFEAKFWDVIGLYLNPPDRALVLCCDEKSQIQALQRTQPGLPLGIEPYPHPHARLRAPRHRHAVRGAELPRWQDHQPHGRAARPRRVAEVPQTHRPPDAGQVGLAPDRRQLRHPQAPRGQEVVEQASPVPHALRTNVEFLAQSG
jgi:transposase